MKFTRFHNFDQKVDFGWSFLRRSQKVDFHHFGSPEHSKHIELRQHSRLGAKSEDLWRNFTKFTRICKTYITRTWKLWNFVKSMISDSSTTSRSHEIKLFAFWVESVECTKIHKISLNFQSIWWKLMEFGDVRPRPPNLVLRNSFTRWFGSFSLRIAKLAKFHEIH